MATYTPNFNLYEPDSMDDFADFRTEFNNNMDIIDQNLGGGGTYTAGDGIKIASNVISLEYFSVVNGAVNITFDDGN